MPSDKQSAAILFAFTKALQPIKRVWVQAVTIAIADHGLPSSVGTTVILAARSGKAGIGQSALADEVGVNPAAMVRILDQAEAAGLVERRDSTADRRVKTVHILPKGNRIATEMEAEIADLRTQFLADVPQQDIETATRVLRLFEERINAFVQQERSGR